MKTSSIHPLFFTSRLFARYFFYFFDFYRAILKGIPRFCQLKRLRPIKTRQRGGKLQRAKETETEKARASEGVVTRCFPKAKEGKETTKHAPVQSLYNQSATTMIHGEGFVLSSKINTVT
mmetsp:Transcript_3729/g.7080  ORF Transcript_3729/g.7080 Transcript_3729/m.7080 type:complete len:120 (+) Transcript_3729:170-529(+)